jgi:hypothetical protein
MSEAQVCEETAFLGKCLPQKHKMFDFQATPAQVKSLQVVLADKLQQEIE